MASPLFLLKGISKKPQYVYIKLIDCGWLLFFAISLLLIDLFDLNQLWQANKWVLETIPVLYKPMKGGVLVPYRIILTPLLMKQFISAAASKPWLQLARHKLCSLGKATTCQHLGRIKTGTVSCQVKEIAAIWRSNCYRPTRQASHNVMETESCNYRPSKENVSLIQSPLAWPFTALQHYSHLERFLGFGILPCLQA